MLKTGILKFGDCRRWLYSLFPIPVLALLLFVIPGQAEAAEDIEDADITAHIISEARIDDTIQANSVDVATSEGVVTLDGPVDTILTRDRIQRIAEATVGVRAVVNNIQVAPPISRTDRELTRDVRAALTSDPATESYEVDVEVNNGIVNLNGLVDSWQEKQLCTTVVKDVIGVKGVENDITVDFKTDRPDHEIHEEIEQRQANDVMVDDALVNVAVSGGEVVLTGVVGSLQEKNRARDNGWVAGVRDVNARGLVIEWWARDDMRRDELYVSRSDSELEAAIKDAFLYDPRIYGFNIDVRADNGTVYLGGVVDNLEAKQSAASDARNTTGVHRVVNDIKVRPEDLPGNDELEQRVQQALGKDPYVERFNIDVAVYSGTVYLTGMVNTSWEKNRAGKVTEGVKDVIHVVNNIDYEKNWVWKPDHQIREDVKDQLFWSPFIDEDQVDISVENGVVTLTGNVSTYSERQTAEDNAYEGGAKDVINNITVSYQAYGPYDYYGPYNPYFYYLP